MQWALVAAAQFKDFEFKASTRWVNKFKQRHKIRQRKITRFVTHHEAMSLQEILNSADNFRLQARELINQMYDKDYVINTDQTGI